MKLLLSFCLLISLSSSAQNLVINGSFEDPNVCSEIHQFCSPSAWFYIKNHPQGYGLNPVIQPSDGKCLLQLYAVNAVTGKRTYWETMLLCSLVKGKEYTISVDMSATETGPNLNDLGFLFTDNFIIASTDTLMQPSNYVTLLDARAKRLKNGWFRVEKKFTADADHRFLVIGNFSSQSNKEIGLQRKSSTNISYFIDNLSIVPNYKNDCEVDPFLIDSLYSLHDRHSYEFLNEDVKPPPAPPKPTPKPLKIDTLVLNNILFDFDKYTIKNTNVFDPYRKLFTDPSLARIEVTGYTDDAGSAAYNLELSQQRAASVARLLSEKFSISVSIIESSGKGVSVKYKDKKQNRRVEIYIYRKSE